jgi:uncharacterized membrane protein YhaH (DUF805 family)
METFVTLLLLAGLAWACWHWFLREWLQGKGWVSAVKAKLAANNIPDEAYFEMASKEIRGGNLREGLWTKAWSEAMGDQTKAQAIYIRLRVESMKEEAERRFRDWGVPGAQQSAAEKTILDCPKCAAKLRVPSGKLLNVRCTKCGHEFRADTTAGNRIEEYPDTKDQTIGRIGRLAFLWWWLGIAFAGMMLMIVVKEGGMAAPSLSPITFSTWLTAALIYFNFAILIARFRDADKSGWWAAIGLIPFVYLLVVFYLLVVPGTPGRNRFGPKDIGLFVS